MMKVFIDNQELNDLVNVFYERIKDLEVKDIRSYLAENGLASDFDKIEFVTQRKANEDEKKLALLYLKSFMYSLPIISKEKTSEKLMIEQEMENIEEDKKDFYMHFLTRYEDIKNMVLYTFDKYYESCLKFGYDKDLKEFLAIYKSVIYYIISMLPDSYKEEVLDEFGELFDNFNLGENYQRAAYLIKKFNDNMRNYLLKKYKIDLYNTGYEKVRKAAI